MADNRPRLFQGSRDMVLSLLVSAIIMIGAVGFTGMCTYSPGAPEQGQIPEVDAGTFISMEARGMDFAVREPETPEGWTTNSARRSVVAGAPAPVIGYVTADGGYIQLTQTGATPEDAAAEYDGRWRDLEETYQVNGFDVGLYTSAEREVRDLRILDLQDARVLLSGAATDEEFEELIVAAIEAPPLPTS